jgi:hypothetical protein
LYDGIFLQELNTFEGDGFGCALDIAPDGSGGREFAYGEAEALDGEPAVVVQIL